MKTEVDSGPAREPGGTLPRRHRHHTRRPRSSLEVGLDEANDPVCELEEPGSALDGCGPGPEVSNESGELGGAFE